MRCPPTRRRSRPPSRKTSRSVTAGAPKRILGNGKVTGIELKRCTRVFDEKKRFSPAFDENALTSIDADQIIVAIGQMVDEQTVSHISVQTERGCFKADPVTGQTSIESIFAGGDNTSGPASVIEAVAAGKRVAESIERYLKEKDLLGGRFEETLRPLPQELLPELDKVEKKSRPRPEELSPASRLRNFDEVEKGLTEEQALAEAERCLNCALCSECYRCVDTCKQNAIDHAMKERTITLEVGSVILTPGFDEFDASLKGEFGYGRYPNVVTSVQYERMLSAAGPFEGHVIRLSDGREARRIAWIQCVGSRDKTCGNEYCSSICCMMATKQALVTGDHVEGLDATIFYMDIRAHGKDFDQYYERARAKDNIHYIKSIPSRIVQLPGSKDLQLAYFDENGGLSHKEFDLIVLSVGMEPPHSMAGLAAEPEHQAQRVRFLRHRPAPATVQFPARRVRGRRLPGAQGHSRDRDPGQRRGVHGHGAARAGPQFAGNEKELSHRARCHR